MNASTAPAVTHQFANQSLFESDLEEQLLLSVHLLGKPTVKQLHRLHQDQVGRRKVHDVLKGLSGRRGYLNVIKPLEIERPQFPLPHIFLDTRLSRRLLEQKFGIAYRRTPNLPSRDWRFLRHDVMLVDELVSLELSALRHRLPFGYQSHFDDEGRAYFPIVTVADCDLVHRLRPQPDKTIICGNYHLPLEFDCGEEQITMGNIIRDSSIARKFLVYEAVERSGALDRLGWGKRVYLFVVTTRTGSVASARKRIKSMIAAIPEQVDAKRFFFIDRQTHQGAGDDVSKLEWVRGDGCVTVLPPFRKR